MSKKQLTLKEFYGILSEHDWYYQYSDDYGVWKKGNEEAARIRQLLQHERVDIFKFRELYNDWVRYSFDKGPKPVQPE